MSGFDSAFSLVVGVEGGYVNDPKDPGGETKYGISKRAYPSLDIANLTMDEAKAIYLKDYWVPSGCAFQPWDRALILFDAAVNQGVSFAKTLPSDPVQMMVTRTMRYIGNPVFERYGKGWLARLFTVMKQTQHP